MELNETFAQQRPRRATAGRLLLQLLETGLDEEEEKLLQAHDALSSDSSFEPSSDEETIDEVESNFSAEEEEGVLEGEHIETDAMLQRQERKEIAALRLRQQKRLEAFMARGEAERREHATASASEDDENFHSASASEREDDDESAASGKAVKAKPQRRKRARDDEDDDPVKSPSRPRNRSQKGDSNEEQKDNGATARGRKKIAATDGRNSSSSGKRHRGGVRRPKPSIPCEQRLAEAMQRAKEVKLATAMQSKEDLERIQAMQLSTASGGAPSPVGRRRRGGVEASWAAVRYASSTSLSARRSASSGAASRVLPYTTAVVRPHSVATVLQPWMPFSDVVQHAWADVSYLPHVHNGHFHEQPVRRRGKGCTASIPVYPPPVVPPLHYYLRGSDAGGNSPESPAKGAATPPTELKHTPVALHRASQLRSEDRKKLSLQSGEGGSAAPARRGRGRPPKAKASAPVVSELARQLPPEKKMSDPRQFPVGGEAALSATSSAVSSSSRTSSSSRGSSESAMNFSEENYSSDSRSSSPGSTAPQRSSHRSRRRQWRTSESKHGRCSSRLFVHSRELSSFVPPSHRHQTCSFAPLLYFEGNEGVVCRQDYRSAFLYTCANPTVPVSLAGSTTVAGVGASSSILTSTAVGTVGKTESVPPSSVVWALSQRVRVTSSAKVREALQGRSSTLVSFSVGLPPCFSHVSSSSPSPAPVSKQPSREAVEL